MREELKPIELTREVTFTPGVCFDPEYASLEGTYTDQISAYRARRVWTEALETNFLIDSGHDFLIKVESFVDEGRFTLKCDFLTACGRYAFWRLTHNQAPEAQYLIETAHIPFSEARITEHSFGADLAPREGHEPLILDQNQNVEEPGLPRPKKGLFSVCRALLRGKRKGASSLPS